MITISPPPPHRETVLPPPNLSAQAEPARQTEAAPITAEPTGSGMGALWAGDLAAWVKIWGGTNTFSSHFKLWLNQCGVRATLLFRISQALHAARIPFLPGWVSRWNLTLHGLDIPPSVPIGPGLYIPHPVGTVVMARSLGANVSLIASITIGMRNEHAFPTLGDNVFVGAGARVLGGITIGDNANIGANAVVVKDVPSGRTAVGVLARLLPVSGEAAPAVKETI